MFSEAESEMESGTPHRRREASDNVGERFQSACVRSDTLGLGPVDGVAPVDDNPEAAEIDAHSRMYRCFRDNAWAAREKKGLLAIRSIVGVGSSVGENQKT